MEWLSKNIFLVVAIGFVIAVSAKANTYRSERNVATEVVGQLLMSYEGHLYAEYGKTICGVEPVVRDGVKTYILTREKDSACMAGIREKAKEEVARLMLIKE